MLEFGAWARQVWDVVRARAESRYVAFFFLSRAETVLTRSGRRGKNEIVSHIRRLSPPSPAHWTCAPSAHGEPSAESLLATGSAFLVRPFSPAPHRFFSP